MIVILDIMASLKESEWLNSYERLAAVVSLFAVTIKSG